MLGLLRLALVSSLVVFVSSCSLFKTTCEEDDRECIGPGPGLGVGLGKRCTITADCKENLICDNGRCRATGGVESCENRDGDSCVDAVAVSADGMSCDNDASHDNEGDQNNTVQLCTQACFEACEKCRLTLDCNSVDYCGSRRCVFARRRRPRGLAVRGHGDCERELVCELPDLTDQGVLTLNDLATLTGTCELGGTGEQGDPCMVISDCLGVCSAPRSRSPIPQGLHEPADADPHELQRGAAAAPAHLERRRLRSGARGLAQARALPGAARQRRRRR